MAQVNDQFINDEPELVEVQPGLPSNEEDVSNAESNDLEGSRGLADRIGGFLASAIIPDIRNMECPRQFFDEYIAKGWICGIPYSLGSYIALVLKLILSILIGGLIFLITNSMILGISYVVYGILIAFCTLYVLIVQRIQSQFGSKILKICLIVVIVLFAMYYSAFVAANVINLQNDLPMLVRRLLERIFGGVSDTVVRVIMLIISSLIPKLGTAFQGIGNRACTLEHFRLAVLSGNFEVVVAVAINDTPHFVLQSRDGEILNA